MDRRKFISLIPGSAAALMVSCRPPDEKIVPMVNAVEYMTPGRANYFSTVFQHKNAAYGVLAKSFEGRPVKIEGNDRRTPGGGASSAIAQASLYSLYDPARFRKPRAQGREATLDDALSKIRNGINVSLSAGKKVRFLIDEGSSPAFMSLIDRIEGQFPGAGFVTVPAIRSNAPAVNKALLGTDSEFVPDLSKADYILSVGADFLGADKFSPYYIGRFSENRRPSPPDYKMSKLAVVESALSLTGANADLRIILRPDDYEDFLAEILKEIVSLSPEKGIETLIAASGLSRGVDFGRAKEIAREMYSKRGKSLALAGGALSERSHALCVCINYMLGNYGAGRILSPDGLAPYSGDKSPRIDALKNEISSGEVGSVVFCEIDVEYFGDSKLRKALSTIQPENKYSITYYSDETAQTCSINIPAASRLESWGDAVAFDGTLAVRQPLIAPLNRRSLSTEEFLLKLFWPAESYYDFVRETWRGRVNDREWERTLRDGFFQEGPGEKKGEIKSIELNIDVAMELIKPADGIDRAGGGILCGLYPSNALYDGSEANNVLLLELPDPITKLTYENAAIVSAATAKQLELTDGDIIEIEANDAAIELPALIQPGAVDGFIAAAYGFGRAINGKSHGANAFRLLSGEDGGQSLYVKVKKTGRKTQLAVTQKHSRTEGRDFIRETSLEKLRQGRAIDIPKPKTGPGLYEEYKYKGSRWGMTVDLSACVGCGACVIACQTENNIPPVCKEEIIKGRSMHWISLHRYYIDVDGTDNATDVLFQTMLCQHCGLAPCESVCPVSATTHSPEGLNETTYNRCVGTRYCMINCPYKARCFNFFNYGEKHKPPLNMALNPNVTVRMRGIVEKCTFCIQRINEAKFKARDAGLAKPPDGAVLTACQQACPAGAIVFGDLNDPDSRASKLSKDPRAYYSLEELNTQPSVAYLMKVRNRPGERA